MYKHIAPLLLLAMVFTFSNTEAQTKHQAGVRLGSTDQVLSTGFTFVIFSMKNQL